MMRRLFLLTGSLLVILFVMGSGMAAADDDDLKFKARLTGADEVPANSAPTRGEAKLEVNMARATIKYKLKIEDGQGVLGAAGAHLHCAPAGANGPVVMFLSGVINGGLNGEVEIEATLSNANIINPACGATVADLVQSMINGNVYVNAHSIAFPGGVARGQLKVD